MSNASTIHVVDEEVTGAGVCLYFMGLIDCGFSVCILWVESSLFVFCGLNKVLCLYFAG